jgi:Acetyltransferase (GNAT) domain
VSTGVYHHRCVVGDELAGLAGAGTSIFQGTPWLRVVEEGAGYHPFGVLTDAGDPMALVIWFETRRGPLRLAGSPLPGCMTAYQRPIWIGAQGPRDRGEVLRQQLGFLRSRGFASIEWVLPEVDEDLVLKARGMGAVVSSIPTTLLDVEHSRDVMWKKLTSRGRNMVRKAEKGGVTVRRCTGTHEEAALFYGMLEGTFAKSGLRPPHPFKFYQAMWRHLIPSDRLLFLAAEADGRILAMALCVHDDREMFFTSGTSLPGVGGYAPNNLLQWHAIQFAIERGLRVYDLGGTGRAGIDQFKMSFGGRPYAYAKFAWRSPAARMAVSAYGLARPALERVRFLWPRP